MGPKVQLKDSKIWEPLRKDGSNFSTFVCKRGSVVAVGLNSYICQRDHPERSRRATFLLPRMTRIFTDDFIRSNYSLIWLPKSSNFWYLNSTRTKNINFRIFPALQSVQSHFPHCPERRHTIYPEIYFLNPAAKPERLESPRLVLLLFLPINLL